MMVVTHGARVAAAGGATGWFAAMLLARWLRSAAGFDGGPLGWIWLAGPAILLLAALIASVLPAARILRVDPLSAMRTE